MRYVALFLAPFRYSLWLVLVVLMPVVNFVLGIGTVVLFLCGVASTAIWLFGGAFTLGALGLIYFPMSAACAAVMVGYQGLVFWLQPEGRDYFYRM